MKLFSLNYLKTSFLETLQRFPLPVLAALLFTFNACGYGLAEEGGVILAALFCCFFALVSLKLVFESQGWDLRWHYISALLLCFVIIWFFRYVEMPLLAFQFLGPVSFLSIFAAPFLKKDVDGFDFWNFAYRISMRISLTLLAAIILYVAVMAILVTFSALFGTIGFNFYYMELWIVIAAFFSPVFALSGIPTRFSDDVQDYPQFKVITYYIILPAAVIYAALLHLYAVKILTEWTLPDGFVSYLVMGFSAAALLTYIACYPLYLKQEETVEKFVKYLPYLLIVPVILLFVAIGSRIKQYGITEDRYTVVMLGIWIIASALFIFFKNRRLPPPYLILVTLIVLAILASFGPWGAVEVSARSQINRLTKILEASNRLQDGKIVAESELPFADRKEVSGILDYLSKTGKEERIYAWSPNYVNDKFETEEEANRFYGGEALAKKMGLEYVDAYRRDDSQEEKTEYVTFNSSCYDNEDKNLDCSGSYRNIASDIKAYDMFVLIENTESLAQQNNDDGYVGRKIVIKGKEFQLFIRQDKFLTIREKNTDNTTEINLADFVVPLGEPQKKEIAVEGKDIAAKLVVRNMSGYYDQEKNDFKINMLDAALFIGVK